MQAPKNLLRQLSDLDQLFESLGQDTGEILTRAFPAQDIARTAAGGVSFDIGLEGMQDCSKLGGNSGSSILDLETNLVIVLHFCG
jgi:hypothetical protein